MSLACGTCFRGFGSIFWVWVWCLLGLVLGNLDNGVGVLVANSGNVLNRSLGRILGSGRRLVLAASGALSVASGRRAVRFVSSGGPSVIVGSTTCAGISNYRRGRSLTCTMGKRNIQGLTLTYGGVSYPVIRMDASCVFGNRGSGP